MCFHRIISYSGSQLDSTESYNFLESRLRSVLSSHKEGTEGALNELTFSGGQTATETVLGLLLGPTPIPDLSQFQIIFQHNFFFPKGLLVLRNNRALLQNCQASNLATLTDKFIDGAPKTDVFASQQISQIQTKLNKQP